MTVLLLVVLHSVDNLSVVAFQCNFFVLTEVENLGFALISITCFLDLLITAASVASI